MTSVWRRGGWRGLVALPFLHLAARGQTLFPDTGRNIPFALENSCRFFGGMDGECRMLWKRTFHFPGKLRCFTAEMRYDPARGAIVDWLGNRRQLEVELHPSVVGGSFEMVSGKQWLCTRVGRIPLPRLLTGQAMVREEELHGGWLKISVTISNPLLGRFFGYVGDFTNDDREN